MSNVYEKCPSFENEKWLLRLVMKEDSDDLMEVYGEKAALPFFNSDNCHGDNFYYPTKEKMDSAIDFWIYSYNEKFFVRWAIIDKFTSKAVGTIEMFHRDPNGDFGHVGLIRIDLGSEIISKVPIYAVERVQAFSDYGFEKSDICLIGGNDKYAYNGYWSYKK